MSDEATQLPPITVNGQYIKDLSFESPNAPTIFADMQNNQPDINVNIDVQAAKSDQNDTMYEVILTVKGGCKVADKTAFAIELEYAGLFTINVPEKHLQPVLLVECPRMLFPFARNIIADSTRDGGFMPLMLNPIDFAGMYQQRMADAQAAKDEGSNETVN